MEVLNAYDRRAQLMEQSFEQLQAQLNQINYRLELIDENENDTL